MRTIERSFENLEAVDPIEVPPPPPRQASPATQAALGRAAAQGAQKGVPSPQALGQVATSGASSHTAAQAWLGEAAVRGARTMASPTAVPGRAQPSSPSNQPARSLLDRLPNGYEVVDTRRDGTTDTYKGHDITAFVEHRDDFHAHEVTTPSGDKVYARDRWGFVHEGTEAQLDKQARAATLGHAAVRNSPEPATDPEPLRSER